MHYPNLTFHGVEAIRLGVNIPHSCMHGWRPGVLEHVAAYRLVKRPAPNPNVFLELGYAAASIGWNRLILVQNTAFGDISTLSFASAL